MFGIVLFSAFNGFSHETDVKTASILNKENCLHIGMSWWGIKGIIGSNHRCSCGCFLGLERLQSYSRNGYPMDIAC